MSVPVLLGEVLGPDGFDTAGEIEPGHASLGDRIQEVDGSRGQAGARHASEDGQPVFPDGAQHLFVVAGKLFLILDFSKKAELPFVRKRPRR